MDNHNISRAQEHFATLVQEQLDRVQQLKAPVDWIDYATLKPVIIGICGGDGIGPIISQETQLILRHLIAQELTEGKVEIRTIEGLTIENRVKQMKAIPDDVLNDIKACHVILKGPTTTPEKGDNWPNIESANVAMRRSLDLFANVRPVRVPSEGIDWMFFRENTEGSYLLGSRGIKITDDLTFDFKVTTRQGAERVIRLAFEYASRNDINKVAVVTKANVIKTTDGLFLDVARDVSIDFPSVQWEGWYIDITTAKILDPKRRKDFRVFVLQNLYGDILTDEAAEIQGGVGTAGSANIGKQSAMFEAIHGSAPRMIQDGRGKYSDPVSLIRAGALMLHHIGLKDKAAKLDMALDICVQYEKKITITGRDSGCTTTELSQYVLETLDDPNLHARWKAYASELA